MDVAALVEAAEARLRSAPPPARQPVHVVYGGAHLFKATTARRLGELALASLDRHAPDPRSFARAIGLPEPLAEPVWERVVAKLRTEPVEDLRVDFEDGFGPRSDADEDAAADRVAAELALARRDGLLPPFVGIRIKAMTRAAHRRAARTLDRVVTGLVDRGGLPDGFVVTLPKVAVAEQVHAACAALADVEARCGLPAGAIGVELMVELAQTLLDETGRCPLPDLVTAGAGRVRACHFGTYDFTASLGVSAAWQSMRHPAADLGKHLMQLALAGTGVALSDGATTELPLGDTPTVHRAWARAYGDIRHSLAGGFTQGWDLHPAQIPVRFAAVYAFFLEDLDGAAARLKAFVDTAARARAEGAAFDDAATGQGLLNHFLRAHAAGALRDDEVARAGLTLHELRTRDFGAILASRAGR